MTDAELLEPCASEGGLSLLEQFDLIPAPSREDIDQLEANIRAHPNFVPAEGYPVRHFFGKGWYGREVTIWAGHAVVGKVHKTEHFSVLGKGTLNVTTAQGRTTLTGPAFVHGLPGTKRIGAALTDVVWTTFHLTEETDIDKLEAMLIEAPEAECLGYK